MGAVERIKFNKDGMESILTGNDARDALRAIANRISSRATGSTVEDTEDAPGEGDTFARARVRVYGNLQDEADTGYLSRALGGDR